MSFVEITEEWVKDRVQIKKEKLDDIKSLLLPGTFDEKICNIGSSLIHFTRLKELDLSRNVLETLDGLSHLQCLENLNLYYNNVASLKELYKLRNNQKLTQLDLRLNPVARNEADYRLFLIHMLPLLIRLDDRCVKDEERKAALMYFGSDQSHEFATTSDTVLPSSQSIVTKSSQSRSHRKAHPRVEMVNRWTKGALTDYYKDDDPLGLNLNDLNQSETDNTLTPRQKGTRHIKEYSTQVKTLDKELREKSDHLSVSYSQGPSVKNSVLRPTRREEHKKILGKRLDIERQINSFRQLESGSNIATVPVCIPSDDKNVSNKKYHYDNHLPIRPGPSLKQSKEENGLLEDFQFNVPKEMIDYICDLVDRYWNGTRSLHQNPKFLVKINNLIGSHFAKFESERSFNDTGLVTNEKLSRGYQGTISVAPNNNTGNCDELSEIKQANQILQEQIRELRKKLHVSEQAFEITELLKQSHESLIATNEQLRRQLDSQSRRNSFTK